MGNGGEEGSVGAETVRYGLTDTSDGLLHWRLASSVTRAFGRIISFYLKAQHMQCA